MPNRPTFFKTLGLVAACGLAVSCGSGSGPQGQSIKPGTPAFYWASATQTFKNGDFAKTSENLARLATSTEYSAKSQPWRLILASGMAQGNVELGEKYEFGGKVNKAIAIGFQRAANVCRTNANSYTLEFVETLHDFRQNNKDAQIALAFPLPPGTAAEPSAIGRITKGILPPEAERASLERDMNRRGVLLAAARVLGAKDDGAKLTAAFKDKAEVTVPREQFMRAMAGSLYDRAQLYLPKQLDQPKRLQVLCNEALEAMKAVPQQSKEDKELIKKITDTLKKYKLDS
jgi:hypothetical protein